MKSDANGCSTCPAGEENWEEFTWVGSKKKQIQYDYRTPDGKLFSCIADTLDKARRKRDGWLKRMENQNNVRR